MHSTLRLLLALSLLVTTLVATADDHSSSQKPMIIVSIKPLALMVQGLAGDDFSLRTLGSGSSDPHAQAMTIADRAALEQADLVVWLGPRFERFLAKPMGTAKQAQLQLGVEPAMQWPGAAGVDLHLWLNPNNAAVAYRALAKQLVLLKPAAADLIDARLAERLAELAKVQAEIAVQLAPYQHVPFAVSHDGFGHYVQAFGLMQLAAATQLPEEQLSVRRMAELNRILVNARCLLVEPQDHHGHKLAHSVNLPEVSVDVLGRNEAILTLPMLLQSVTVSFLDCFSHAATEHAEHEAH